MNSALAKLLLLLCALPLSVLAAPSRLPDWLPLAPGMDVAEVRADERYGEALVPTPKQDRQVVRGRRWEATLRIKGAGNEASGKALWARWKPVLAQQGWTAEDERETTPYAVSARLTKGRDAWFRVTLFDANDIRIDLVEVGENRLKLSLKPPAAKPEPVKADGTPFPYLPPPPGAKFSESAQSNQPMLVKVIEKDAETLLNVAAGSIAKYYRTPKDLSNLDFALAYRDALVAAGWTVPRISHGVNAGNSMVVAHYGANGRDLWAVLVHTPGDAAIEVGDAGLDDLARALKKDCRATLAGVHFDFDKATLRPESDAVLGRARAAIAANAGLALEVQGHTDAVGNDAYNQKLSEARAKAVMAWLVGKGVPAAQLTASGYGKTKPVADNETDRGRALNRRVDLACRK